MFPMNNDANAGSVATEDPCRCGRPTKRWLRRSLTGFVLPLLAAIVIAVGIRSVAVEAYVIPSESMLPTLQVNDRILVAKTSIDFNGISQGDLVVFTPPTSAAVGTPQVLIKRVIAIGGETIQAQGGAVFVNGAQLDEPYVSSATASFEPVHLAAGQLFLMGDNRSNSADSRVFGPVEESSVIGSAFERIWPLNHVGGLD